MIDDYRPPSAEMLERLYCWLVSTIPDIMETDGLMVNATKGYTTYLAKIGAHQFYIADHDAAIPQTLEQCKAFITANRTRAIQQYHEDINP